MFTYKFSNLLAAPYSCSQAHISFDRKGTSLYSPSSNRVSRYILSGAASGNNCSSGTSSSSSAAFDSTINEQQQTDDGSKVFTFSFEARVDVCHFCVRSDGLLAISIDLHGQGLVVNLVSGFVLNRIRFKSNTSVAKLKWKAEKDQHYVHAAAFSPDDELFGVACGRAVQEFPSPYHEGPAWLCPQWEMKGRPTALINERLDRKLLAVRPITCLSWSPDSLHLVTGSQDCTVRLWRARGKWGVSTAAAAAAAFRRLWLDAVYSEAAEFGNVEEALTTDHQEAEEQQYRDEVDRAFTPSAFVSHRHELRFACFSSCLKRIYSVNREGVIIVWAWQTEAEAKEQYGEMFDPKKNAARPTNPAYFQQRRERQKEAERQKETERQETTEVGNGKLAARRPVDEVINYAEGLWHMEQRAYCCQDKGQRVSHAATNLSPYYRYPAAAASRGLVRHPPQYLLIGFTGGVFQLYTLPHLETIVKLSLGVCSLDSVCLSFDGEWIAAAAAGSNTLVVWEWRSETYVLRQLAHRHGVRCVAFSPAPDAAAGGASRIGARAGTGGPAQTRAVSGLADAATLFGLGASRGVVATGSNEGALKVWDAESGYCYCTFEAHSAAVTAVCFSPTGNALFSASLDGTVKAFDLLRFQPFRVFTARSGASSMGFGSSYSQVPVDFSVQFTCIATDSGGELIAAGSQGSCFNAFVWSVRTAKLLEELAGHEAPVVAVAFHPHPNKQGLLATGSWDKQVKVWNLFERRSRGGAPESLLHSSGVCCLAFDPKGGALMAVGGESGKISLWDVGLGDEGALNTIECLRDIQGGRKFSDRMAKNAWATKEKQRVMGLMAGLDLNACVTSLSFSSTGSLLLASSRNCPKVFLYEVGSGVLISYFQLTMNRLLEGISRELNSKFITDGGAPVQEYDLSDVEDDLKEGERERKRIRDHRSIPGVSLGEFASKRKNLFLVFGAAFSADSRCFAAATSHGMYIYSIDLNRGMVGSHGVIGLVDSPSMLTQNVTTASIFKALSREEYAKAFVLALVSEDLPTLLCVYERVPVASIPLVCSSLAPSLLPRLLFFLHTVLSTDVAVGTRHLQIHLLWLSCVLKLHMHVFQGDLATCWAESLKSELKKAEKTADTEIVEKARKAKAFSQLSRKA